MTLDDITCRELVELVSDYLDGSLAEADRARFEAHVEICDACSTYIEQIRATVAISGRVTEEDLQPETREGLMSAFRGWKRETAP